MIEIKCKELYRVPIEQNLIKEIYEMGKLTGERDSIIKQIYNIQSISDKLKIDSMIKYYKEWCINMKNLLKRIREKTGLQNEKYCITHDFESGELIVVDILKDEYDKCCIKNDYLVIIKIIKDDDILTAVHL